MQLYEVLGRPLVEYNTFWGIYRQILHAFEGVASLTPVFSAILGTHPLPPEMKNLRGGDGVIGDQEARVR